MEYKIAAGQVLTDNGWENEKIITIKDGIIADIEEAGAQESLFTDEHIAYLTPGVIDNHLHGGEGYDILEGNDENGPMAGATRGEWCCSCSVRTAYGYE